ncbi:MULTISPECIES: carboxymuconolactone decarboxylase family protein [unclassified Agarivorans]|uniref:carboxymuconolactone decarboxylase family protein n=1 Tax=unclassified Agarivorans TaxID=2636026 RepID=UPI0026E3238F|nr:MULTISPECIES: carboxymuconolactone decarboxylase family protein [unclassified Agarivorans]MDO6685015.1 carboxymuconolactone decarboxylase family protein [Agarivorans sp. 3_MG-2023]MDO6717427.1 carboxymuconolactone decarboxylase family protein [Agarivorans sp. 2_MG-2023]
MTTRLNYFDNAPKGMEILMQQEDYLRGRFLESDSVNLAMWELVKLRISQINQCAFCIDMHSKDALKAGETAQRIIGLSAWKDMPWYTQNERMALSWAEQLSAGQPISDALYRKAHEAFGEPSLVDLTIAINAINSWNRIAKAFTSKVGSYTPS